MAQFPALNLWTDSWLADTAHMPRVDRDIYFHLLILMWRTPGCRVPNEIEWIAARLRLTASEIPILKAIILEFCKSSGNWLIQKRLLREFQASTRRSKKASVSAKHRYSKEKGSRSSSATTTTTTTTTTDTNKNTPLSPPQGGQKLKGNAGHVGRKKRASLREKFFHAVDHIETRCEAGGDEGGDEGGRENPVLLPGLRQGNA